jgi:hypothetical protein
MTAIDNARSYDWKTWLIGIMRSFLSGGAAALVTGGGGTIAGITAKQQYIMMGASFLGLGLYRMGEFLTLHGAPDQVQQSLNVAEEKTKEAVAAVQDAKKSATPIDKQ